MGIKTNELPLYTSLESEDSFLVDTATGTGRLSIGNAKKQFIIGENILDNWNFSIWQRYPDGVYTGVPNNTYIADRWSFSSWDGAKQSTIKRLDHGGFYIESGPQITLKYKDERAPVLAGKILTISVLLDTGLRTVTAKFADNLTENDSLLQQFKDNGVQVFGSGEKVFAMKLELGDHQTLAHQDASGNWVLNDPPPNKAMELLKCRYYFNRIDYVPDTLLGLGYVESNKAITAPIYAGLMRINPTVITDGNTALIASRGALASGVRTVISPNTALTHQGILNMALNLADVNSTTLNIGNVYRIGLLQGHIDLNADL